MPSANKPTEVELFEALRRPGRAWLAAPTTATAGEVHFRISLAADGARVEAVDDKGKPWLAGYEYAHGVVRDVLKALAMVRERGATAFAWDKQAEHVYLDEHDHLIPLLARTGKLVDQQLRPLTLDDQPARLCVSLATADGNYAAELVLRREAEAWSAFELLSESYALTADRRILPLPPLGPRFADLKLFATQFPAVELDRYLTLLVSTADHLDLELEGYRKATGPPREAEPCVIFEDVDEEGCLKLRLGMSLKGFEPDFLDNYEITRTATVNELERKVVVCDVVHRPMADCLAVVVGALKRAAKGTPGGFYQDNGFFLVEPALAGPFLEDVLPTLLARHPCFGAEHLRRFKLRTSRPKVILKTVGSGIDFLDTQAALQIDDQLVPLAEALKHFRQQAYIPLNDGTRALLNPDYLRQLERIFRRQSATTVRVSLFDLPFLDDLIEETEQARLKELAPARKIFAALAGRSKVPPPAVNAQMRPYQRAGYEWLHRLHAAGLGGCLADDMGLGKTLQALAVLQTTRQPDSLPSLIVMPKSLLFNWQAEIAKFTPALSCAVYHGSARFLPEALKAQLILTTYGTLRSDIEQLKEVTFDYLVLDESQNIKNPNAQATRAALLVDSRHRLALSGTPVENNLTELYSLFRCLNPSMFESLPAFVRDYANPIAKDNDRQAMRDLQRKIAPFMLRRTKRQVLKELPDKMEQILYVEMSPEQAALYELRRRFYLGQVQQEMAEKGIRNCQFAVLQAFTELRQIASTPESRSDGAIASPKRELVVDEIREATANGHKCLLFANFLGAIEALSEDFNAAGIGHLVMTGATRDREQLVRRFQNDDGIQVFLMTLKTGGVGLNLTAADYVFIYDPWWNRAAETQAIDRTHRIGQKNAVFTYKLVTRGSIEEKILQLQQLKGALVDELVGGDGTALKQLTEDDVRFALGIDS